MLPLPKEPTDERRLADWLELLALKSTSQTSSDGDLGTALRAGNLIDPKNPADDLQARVFRELMDRAKAAPDGYPFEIKGALVRVRPEPYEYQSYLFCLCLSYADLRPTTGRLTKPERIFETLCATAAARYVQGEARRFGWPRDQTEFRASFKAAIPQLCEAIGEGGTFKPQQDVSSSGDAGVDIVAWRDHPDRLPGKLLLFGACAAGKDWESKVYELQPEVFTGNYFSDTPPSKVLRAFFVPHRIPSADWDRLVRKAGIVFDRCRIASLVKTLPDAVPHGDGMAWAKDQLRVHPA